MKTLFAISFMSFVMTFAFSCGGSGVSGNSSTSSCHVYRGEPFDRLGDFYAAALAVPALHCNYGPQVDHANGIKEGQLCPSE
jgi:hypothetical protein